MVDPKINLQFDPETRAPRTDEFSVGVDRQIGRRLSVAIVYVRKDGAEFIGWRDVAGVYQESIWLFPDGQSVPVSSLVSAPGARRFRLMNQHEYSLRYDGVAVAAEKRQANGWQAFTSYTFSRARGLQASSGATAAGAQVSTVSPPPPLTFGRDPNDLTNAGGRMPNDRPHIFRVMGSVNVPRTGFVIAGNLQHFSGKPWAATAIIPLRQGDVRVLLEPRGSRRLSSQTLLDLRVSRAFAVGTAGRVELLVDVLNLLNDTAEEALASDNFYSPTEFRSAHGLRGSTSRDGQRQAQPRAVGPSPRSVDQRPPRGCKFRLHFLASQSGGKRHEAQSYISVLCSCSSRSSAGMRGDPSAGTNRTSAKPVTPPPPLAS